MVSVEQFTEQLAALEVFGKRGLIDAWGSGDWDAYERLTKDRDTRPIYLAE